MKKQKVFLAILFALTVCLAPAPHSLAAEKIVIKLAHVDPIDICISKKGAATRAFKEIVEAESVGAIQVDLFPAGQLGGERELIEATKLGTIQMSMVSGAIAGYFKPAMVLDIPYLFPSAAVAWKVLDGDFGRELANDILRAMGTRVLAYGETGFRNFTNSKRVVKSPDDLKGLKIRVMETPLYVTMVKSLKADPTPIAWPETYTALQQKVVDGQENPVSVILQAKFAEVQKYLTLDGHTYGADFLIINEKVFQGLSKEHQQILKRAAIVAGACGRGIQQLNSAVGISELKKQGMEVYSPTAAERKAFMQATQGPVIDWMKTQVDQAWIRKVQAAVTKAEAELTK
ncbi:MAG: DctP family TRAP transporter solute-binding subunit [Proteobacteria bacterium]|nr:DctP family TRAP transporter solute-binding subunit [Pseudomonadota bacterium]